MNFLLIVFIISVLILNLLLRGKVIHSRYINFFKFFFPSWSFFDGSSDTPCLLYKINNSNEWHFAMSPTPTKLHHLFFNPLGNLYMAHHSHIQQLATEIFEKQNDQHFLIEDSINYKISLNFVRYAIKKNRLKSKTFQMKLAYITKDNLNHIETMDDILISPIYDY